jgi:hypothetical protein
MSSIYYLYGFKKGENRMKAKPIEAGCAEGFEELTEAYRILKNDGYVGVFALTKMLPMKNARRFNPLANNVVIGRGV